MPVAAGEGPMGSRWVGPRGVGGVAHQPPQGVRHARGRRRGPEEGRLAIGVALAVRATCHVTHVGSRGEGRVGSPVGYQIQPTTRPLAPRRSLTTH